MPNPARYSLTHRLAVDKIGTLLGLCEREVDDVTTDLALLQDLASWAIRRGVDTATAIESVVRVWDVHLVRKLPDIHFGESEVLYRGELPGGHVAACGHAHHGKLNANVFRARAMEHLLSGWVPRSGS